MTTITIDPGIKGGIAWHIHNVNEIQAVKMPDTPKGIVDLFKQQNFRNLDPICYLEELKGVPPNQSSKATWTFAEHYGTLKGALMALGIPIVYVRAQVWQKAIGATRPPIPKDASAAVKARIKAEGKRNIKKIVEARYPDLRVTLATADALGILMYADAVEDSKQN